MKKLSTLEGFSQCRQDNFKTHLPGDKQSNFIPVFNPFYDFDPVIATLRLT